MKTIPKRGEGGVLVEGYTEQQIVLTCKECEDKLVLFGPVEDWRSRDAVLLCGSAHKITLDEDYADEEVLSSAS
jgi:hypothetical protein